MAIKDPLMFITIEEFKNWKGFNKSLFDEVTTPDSEIRYAIEIASSNIDFLSGFTISKKWPEINPTKFTDNIQTATTHYVNFLLGKGVEYARGQASIGQGGIVYSQNNPEDPYYIVPQVFNYLKEINEYPTMKGFNLDVSPKQNWFKKFMGNSGEQNPWEIYLQTLNLKSSDPRTKITITHPKNIMGSVVDINTRGIKSFDNLTTIELFTKYFSNDTMKLVDGKEGQEKKVISATGSSGESLWLIDPNSPNIIQPKNKRIITSNNTRIVYIADPTQPQDAVNKRYVDNKINNKQDKLTFNNQFKNDNNTISLDTEIVFNKLTIPNVNTTNKTIAGAINENKSNIDKKQDKLTLIKENNSYKVLQYSELGTGIFSGDLDIPPTKFIKKWIDDKIPKENWKIIGKSIDNRTWEDFDLSFNKYYRVFITWDKPPFNQTSVKLKIEFKSSDTSIGGDYTLVKSKIDGEEASLIAKLGSVNGKSQLVIIGGNKEYGNIFSLEELQDTFKVDIEPKLKIKSSTLTTNEVEENIWDIELKNNPTPSPSRSNWKEVGTVGKNKWDNWEIKYDFKDNSRYRVYYNWGEYDYIKIMTEFIHMEAPNTNEIVSFNNGDNHMVLSMGFGKNLTIYSLKGKSKGKLWKLEELQE